MSDSEDDWFEKDIEKHVQNVKSKITASVPRVKGSTKFDEQNINFINHVKLSEDDYGGSYGCSSSSRSSNLPRLSNSKKNTSDFLEVGYIQSIPMHNMIAISKLTSLEVFLEISSQHHNFIETLYKDNLCSKTIQVILEIMLKICHTPMHETVNIFLSNIFDKPLFLHQISEYVKQLSQNFNVVDKQKILNDSNLEMFVDTIVQICRYYINNLGVDEEFVKFVKSFTHKLNVSSLVTDHVRQLLEEIDNYQNKITCNNIYPTLDELKAPSGLRMNMQANTGKGKYPGVWEYLDTHLLLLREDFISALRKAVEKFLENPTQNLRELHIYRDVHFQMMNDVKIRNFENILVNLNLGKNNLSTKNLACLKRFMHGSLLMLTTSEKFDDLILAVVTSRDNELLMDGFIQIDIIKTYNNISNIFDCTFILFESDTYFEPYYNVYNALKNFNEHNFPLKDYIIDCKTSEEYPDYIPNIDDNDKIYYKHMQYVFELKNKKTWPSPSVLGLSESQFNAFQAALTKKFCLIQGPPGTGKTFIGYQIAAALLSNTDSQIIVICLTNHALDEFLCGILEYTTSLVRLGDMSKNAIISQYNIKKIAQNHLNVVGDKRIRKSIYTNKKEYERLLTILQELQSKLPNEINKLNQDKIIGEISKVQNLLRSVTKKLNELHQIQNYFLIREKRVIGMTTTYALRCNALLNLLKSSVYLIEESGEVLESHIIALLTNEVQQLILIGDHQQLRPHTVNHDLAKQFKMDVSLFERMVNNGINCHCLGEQYRMRPEIANLIRPVFYKELNDSDNVKSYPDIEGMSKNLFFIDHNFPESCRLMDETTSTNLFEVKFLINFCSYLINRGYKAKEITLLTMYAGQLTLLLSQTKKIKGLECVCVSTVDNYQGEENRIILLSLVRNNPQNFIGFTSNKNRICVALSRAREGLYIIGNMKVMSTSKTWNSIKKILIEQEAIGNGLPIYCKTHNERGFLYDPIQFNNLLSCGCLKITQ